VELHGVTAPEDGDFVSVTGVVGANTSGVVLRMAPSDTITELN